MCGIAGIWNRRSGEPVDRACLRAMAAVQGYRGPDGEGVWAEGAVGFSFRRLAIVDLETGDQPMRSAGGDRVIVFNGEIYNYLELRDELEERGHRFRTRSDTEVILEAHAAWGDACVERLNGMFAFAIWDRRRRQLFLARDRVGIKPLYLAELPGGFAFASELKAFYRIPSFSPRLHFPALDEFFTLGYTTTPHTLLEGVRKLPEGHTLRASPEGVRLRPYWDLPLEGDPPKTFDDGVEGLLDLLRDAIRLRLRADVPLGVFLSGGVDSSLVTMLLSQARGREAVKTFSIGFDFGPRYNELEHARRVARLAGTRQRDMTLSPDSFRDFLPRFVWHMDEPVTEGAALPLHAVSRLAREDVTVVLSGEGADELFAGYPIYGVMQAMESWRAWPPWLRGPLERLARPLARRSPRWERVLDLVQRPLETRYHGVHLYDVRHREACYHVEVAPLAGSLDPLAALGPLWTRSEERDPLVRMLHLDFKTWLPNDILIKADRMSMATSIELRVPFLDHRLIEFAMSLPAGWKMRRRRTKRILKEAAVHAGLPRDLVHRTKMGFPTPLGSLFRGALRETVRDRLLSPETRRRRIFDPAALQALLDAHEKGRADHHKLLWRIVVLEQWLRTFLDRSGEGVRDLDSCGAPGGHGSSQTRCQVSRTTSDQKKSERSRRPPAKLRQSP